MYAHEKHSPCSGQAGCAGKKKPRSARGGSTGVKNTRLGETGLEEFPFNLATNGEHSANNTPNLRPNIPCLVRFRFRYLVRVSRLCRSLTTTIEHVVQVWVVNEWRFVHKIVAKRLSLIIFRDTGPVQRFSAPDPSYRRCRHPPATEPRVSRPAPCGCGSPARRPRAVPPEPRTPAHRAPA